MNINRSQYREPRRIQRKRTKGWRLPEGAVYVGRPSRWGNPWHVHRTERRQWGVLMHAVPSARFIGTFDRPEAAMYWSAQAFRRDSAAFDADFLEPLRGRDLACWCPLEDEHGNRVPCHADVLLELANR